MSEFRSMTITFAKDVTEIGGYFHEITVNDIHAGRLQEVMDYFETAGWEVVSVMIDGYDFQEDMWKHIGDSSNIALLFDALCADSYSADVICAFITERDCADVESWMDSVYISGTDAQSVVLEWTYVFHKVYTAVNNSWREDYVPTELFPSWAVVDWESTLDNIAKENSSSVVEFGSGVYFFG